MNLETMLASFVFFFAVIDPIGTIPVFIAVTREYPAATKRRIAFLATVVAACVLLFFVIAGEFILDAIGIRVSAFQIGGGIVLFLFALSMIFGESKPEEEVRLVDDDHTATAIFPLAIPSIAGPGAMLGAVLLTEKHSTALLAQVATTVAMFAVLLINLVVMLGASWLYRFIGNAGASVISRVMGLILASVAVSNVLEGLKTYFEL